MSRSKTIFLVASILFVVLLVLVSIDISRRTTFPGSKPQLKQRIQDTYIEDSRETQDSSYWKMPDSVAVDSAKK